MMILDSGLLCGPLCIISAGFVEA